MLTRDNLILEKKRERDALVQRIYAQNPELKAVDLAINGKMAQIAKLAFRSNRQVEQEMAEIREEVQALTQKRATLLAAMGLDEKIYEPKWECPICQDRGYVQPGVLCECARRQQRLERAKRGHIAGKLREMTFHNFDVRYYSSPEEMAKKVQRLQAFSTAAVQGKAENNFILRGNTGSGKTHLALACANRVIDAGGTALYINVIDLFEDLVKRSNSKDVESVLAPYLAVDLLVLDDLGAETTSEFKLGQLQRLIEQRGIEGKHWIVTTNLELNDIEKRYGQRISDRLLDHARIFKVNTEQSIRLLQKERLTEKRESET